MADEKKLTMDDLKKLIGEEAERAILAKGYVKQGELKDFIQAEFETVVSEKMKPAFDAEVEKVLARLPGPGKNLTDPDALKGIRPNGGYSCIAEFAKDVQLVNTPGGTPSGRFTKWMGEVNQLNEATKAAGTPTLEVRDPEQGGFLIPPEFSTTLLDKGFEQSNFMSRCTKVPIQRNQISMPFIKDFDHTTYVNGAMMAYWTDELGEKAASKPKFGKVKLELNKLVVLVYSSDELLEDSPISMEPLLTTKATETIGWKVDEAIFRGTGVGQPLGVINAPGRVTVPKESGQAAATIVANNIIKMYSRLYGRSAANAVWVANRQTFPALATMSIAVGTGGIPAWMPANALYGQPYESLYGKPLIWSEQASALGTEGDIALVDFSQYMVGQKRGMGEGIQFAKSIHLMFLYDQTAFRYVLRLDGQPWWPSVYTPKRGDTQSPYITLAVRA